ncbi:MAG TPA: hypothetical protein VHA30_04870 [Patescibacteria group bacterium]|nr:hypothetical protein [Patescibacteria group bacterium]
MLKYHKLTAFCLGLVFLVVVQKFATPAPVFRFLLPAFLAFAAAATLYNRWYLKQIGKYNFWLALRPVLLLCAAFGIFLFLPSEFSRNIFLLLTAGVIAFFEIILGNLAENLLLNETLIVAFGLFESLAAVAQYIPNFGSLCLAGVFAASGLLARSFYEFLPQPETTKTLGALLIGLFCAEFFWALNFLPWHFSVLGLLLFNFFYLLLILNYYYLFHTLSFKKLQFHLGLMAACTLLVLAATPWGAL